MDFEVQLKVSMRIDNCQNREEAIQKAGKFVCKRLGWGVIVKGLGASRLYSFMKGEKNVS